MNADPRYYPHVLQVVPSSGYNVLVYFDDGSIHRFDVEPLLSADVFRPLRDVNVFRQKLTVMNDTVAWDLTGDRSPQHCIDLDPINLYRNTPRVREAEVAVGTA